MNTIIIKVDEYNPQAKDLEIAAGILRAGGVVAFPTETVYGLGANALDTSAAGKIYEAKGRPSDNPLIVHVSEVADLEMLAREIPDKAYQLAEVFWPGPLTIILKKKDSVPWNHRRSGYRSDPSSGKSDCAKSDRCFRGLCGSTQR